QAEDGIRDLIVTGVQTCALPIFTPTGAAIVAALARREAAPEMRIEAVGYGAGDRQLADRPNLLRILLGEPVVAAGADEVVVLEADRKSVVEGKGVEDGGRRWSGK